MQIFGAIQYVTSGITLAAFIAALVLYAYSRRLKSLETRIKLAKEDERAALVDDTLQVFRVDTGKLKIDQRYMIVMEQIRQRERRYFVNAGIVGLVSVLTFIYLLVSLQKSGKAQQLSMDATIESPKENETVKSGFYANGKAYNIDNDSHLWLVVKKGRLVWPKSQSLNVEPNGNWRLWVSEEGPAGEKFDLCLWSANKIANDKINVWLNDSSSDKGNFNSMTTPAGVVPLPCVTGLSVKQ